jgi:hypothetical protein
MFTIWYKFETATHACALNCEVTSGHLARELWDKLNSSGFHMLSTRP